MEWIKENLDKEERLIIHRRDEKTVIIRIQDFRYEPFRQCEVKIAQNILDRTVVNIIKRIREIIQRNVEI
jgi:hypothetical protein